MRVLAGVCKSSELAQLTSLELDENEMGDEGLRALVSACADGALPNLKALSLCRNRIGCAGLSALGVGALACVGCEGGQRRSMGVSSAPLSKLAGT